MSKSVTKLFASCDGQMALAALTVQRNESTNTDNTQHKPRDNDINANIASDALMI